MLPAAWRVPSPSQVAGTNVLRSSSTMGLPSAHALKARSAVSADRARAVRGRTHLASVIRRPLSRNRLGVAADTMMRIFRATAKRHSIFLTHRNANRRLYGGMSPSIARVLALLLVAGCGPVSPFEEGEGSPGHAEPDS